MLLCNVTISVKFLDLILWPPGVTLECLATFNRLKVSIFLFGYTFNMYKCTFLWALHSSNNIAVYPKFNAGELSDTAVIMTGNLQS